MKMKKRKKLNKIVVFLLLLTCIVSITGISAKAAGNASVWLTVNQIIEESDILIEKEEKVFQYSLIPLESRNPMPEGNSGNEYTLTLEGNKEFEIQIDFNQPGKYSYSFKRIADKDTKYVCEEETYTIVVHVKYGVRGELITETFVLKESNQMKVSTLDYVYEYEPDSTSTEPEENGADADANDAQLANATTRNRAVNNQEVSNPEAIDTQEDLEQLGDEAVPRGLRNTDAWALANFILAAVTLLGTIILWIAYLIKKKKSDKSNDETEGNKTVELNLYKPLRIFSTVIAVASVIFFFLTEDITLSVRMADQYTWIMVVAFFAQLIDVLYVWSKGQNQREKE